MPPLSGVVNIYGPEISRAGQIACDEINEQGGVLGRPLELVIEDDGSLPESAVTAAEKLVHQHGCVAIIGNLLSNSRIAVAYRVAEIQKIPYLNFSFYEGSILSRYFFHFAALPNQQIDQMIPFMAKKYGPKMFFAGNNYEWPRGSIAAAKRALEASGGRVMGEEYLALGTDTKEIDNLLQIVEQSDADVLVPYFAGNDQLQFLKNFTACGLKQRMAVVMGHFDEMMASQLSPEVREGFYSSNTYFMTVDTPENREYLQRLARRSDVDGLWPNGNGILTYFGEGTYLCVKAFAQAANLAQSLDPEDLVNALERATLQGPQGKVDMDAATHHATVNTYLSRCQADGTFPIVERFGSIAPLIPERYRHLQISANNQREDDIRLQSRIVDQMTEGVALVDSTNATILYTNPGLERMFGYQSGELLGKKTSFLQAPSTKSSRDMAPNNSPDIDKILYQKGVWKGESASLTKDGKVFWCSVSISAFTHAVHGEVWMSVYKDISESKKHEALFLQAKEAAERASNVKSMFLATMSHEIRTPLMAILGVAELIESTALNEQQMRYVQTSKKAGDALLTLISDILDISKIENEGFDIMAKPFDFVELARSCFEIFEHEAAAKAVAYQFHVDDKPFPLISGDAARVRQVLVNIIGNAVKFTDHGEVVIHIKANPESQGLVPITVTVRDTGIGMSPEFQKNMFIPFSQADSSVTRKFGGTGLGLAIAKKLMEKMGGTISVSSSPGQGSAFELRIFMRPMPMPIGSFSQPPSEQLPVSDVTFTQKPAILLVDDAEDNRFLLGEFLRPINVDVDKAMNGQEALTKFKSRQYDLILMDIQMPIMDGYTAIKAIREWERERQTSPESRPVKIVATTAHAMKEDREKCLDAGADDYIAKPISRRALTELVQSQIPHHFHKIDEKKDDATQVQSLATTSSLNVNS